MLAGALPGTVDLFHAERLAGAPDCRAEQREVFGQKTAHFARQVRRREQETDSEDELHRGEQTSKRCEPGPPAVYGQQGAQDDLDHTDQNRRALDAGDAVQPPQKRAVGHKRLDELSFGAGELRESSTDQEQNETIAKDHVADCFDRAGSNCGCPRCASRASVLIMSGSPLVIGVATMD